MQQAGSAFLTFFDWLATQLSSGKTLREVEAAHLDGLYLRLTAPSGEIWIYNELHDNEVIEGLAEEFSQVVTQVRNIAGTWKTASLVVNGVGR